MKETAFDPTDIRGNLEEIRDLQKRQVPPEVKVNLIWGDKPKMMHKWNLFIGHYLSNGMDGKKAAISAGYGHGGASGRAAKLLARPVIKKEIARVMEKKLAHLGITYEWKMEKLKNVIEKCENGVQLKDNQMNASGAIAGIAELNKMQGHYSPDTTVNLNVDADADDPLLERLMKKNEKPY